MSSQQLSANTQAQETIERNPEILNLGREAPTLTPYLNSDKLTGRSSSSSSEIMPLFYLLQTLQNIYII